MMGRVLFLLLAVACVGTTQTPPPPPEAEPNKPTVSDAGPGPARPAVAPTRLELRPEQDVIAIGDLHGDLRAAIGALRVAGVIDTNRRWIGGDTVVVQVGDQLDRGDDERAILDYFETLSDEAHRAGGGFYPLLGNHETMNVGLDFRYVTPGGWTDFDDVVEGGDDRMTRAFEEAHRGRVRAFRPGGPYARILAGHNAIMVVGGTVFAHGGVLPAHLTNGLQNMNQEIQAWMRGELPRPAFLSGDDSMVWSRHFSADVDEQDCQLLDQVLSGLEVERMVVAHTVQPQGINAACGDKVWRVDVGMSAHYGGSVQVLRIRDGRVEVLR
ncbi:MAG: calcineurin [Myxococcales bacterium]|nr:calcineurin [Myxococcales bacterium]